MLTVLVLSLGVSLLAAVYGRAVLALFVRLAGAGVEQAGPAAPAFPLAVLVGLGVLSAGAGVLALVTRIGAGALAGVLAGGILLAWRARGDRLDRRSAVAPQRERASGGLGRALVWVGRKREELGPGGAEPGEAVRSAQLLALAGGGGLVLGALLALALTALPPANYDSGAYHAQIVRWLEEVGLVPGLGNLHERLAFSAGWLVPTALFSLAFLGGPSLHVLNGTLVLLLLAWAARALAEWRAGGRGASLVLRLILPAAALGLFGRWLSSPAPDVAVAVLVWAAAVVTLEVSERAAGGGAGSVGSLPAGGAAGPAAGSFASTAPIAPTAQTTPADRAERASPAELTATGMVAALAGFAVAVKLSALPVLLLPVLLAGRRLAAGGRRAAFGALALAALLVFPGVAQTVVTTGYPVCPLPGLDPFDFDWEMPAWMVERLDRWIATWARVPHRPTVEVEAMGAGEWLPLWWAHLPASAQAALAAVLVLLPLRAALLLLGRGRHDRMGRTGRSRDRLLLEAALLGGLVFWFVLAPDPRFGWGFLLPLAVLLADGVARALRRAGPGPVASGRIAALPAAALLAVFVVQAWQIYSWEPRTFATAARQVLLPADYPSPSALREETVGGLRVQVPFPNDRCWYHPFPCAPTPDPRLELRGRTLADGFRLRAAAPPAPPRNVPPRASPR